MDPLTELEETWLSQFSCCRTGCSLVQTGTASDY